MISQPLQRPSRGGTSPAIAWSASCDLYDLISRVEIYGAGGSVLIQTIQQDALRFRKEFTLTPAADAVWDATAVCSASSAAQSIYGQLPSFIDASGGLPLFALTGDLIVRVYFVALTSGIQYAVTGAPSATTITAGSTPGAVRLKLLVEDAISADDKESLKRSIASSPKLYRALFPRTQSFTLAASATGLTTLLSGITGPIAFLALSLVDGTTGGEVAITSYQLKDSAGSPVGGSLPVDAKLNRLVASHYWPSDLVATTSKAVLMFAEKPMAGILHGQQTGYLDFSGAESLITTFASLSNASTLRVQYWSYGWVEAYNGELKVHV